MHAAPADLALGDEELAVVLRRSWPASRKVSAISLVLPGRVLVPGLDAGRGIDADAAGRPDADARASAGRWRQALRTCVEEALALVGRRPWPSRRRRRPRSARRTSRPSGRSRRCGRPTRLTSSLSLSMSTCGSARNRSTPSNFCAVDLGIGGQLEQRIERDDRLGIGRALADDAGPHGVVELGIGVRHASRSLGDGRATSGRFCGAASGSSWRSMLAGQRRAAQAVATDLSRRGA